MRHYEIVFLVHPNQSTQVPEMIKQYKSIIESSNGKVHRLEDWGLRRLAYPIKKSSEAYYVLMNVECTQEVRKEIIDSFHFSDAILRNLVLGKEKPIIEHSPIMQAMEKAEKEQALPADDNAEKESFPEAEYDYIEEVDKDTITYQEDAPKATEGDTQPDESNNEKSDGDATPTDATPEIDNTQDTPTEEEHVDSTKN